MEIIHLEAKFTAHDVFDGNILFRVVNQLTQVTRQNRIVGIATAEACIAGSLTSQAALLITCCNNLVVYAKTTGNCNKQNLAAKGTGTLTVGTLEIRVHNTKVIHIATRNTREHSDLVICNFYGHVLHHEAISVKLALESCLGTVIIGKEADGRKVLDTGHVYVVHKTALCVIVFIVHNV